MNEYLEFAMEAAAEAAAIIRAGAMQPKRIEYKGEVDLVTDTDRQSEAAIVGRIRKAFPDHAIVAEEGGKGAAAGARYCWYIDPLEDRKSTRLNSSHMSISYAFFCLKKKTKKMVTRY